MKNIKTTMERVMKYSKDSGYYYYTKDECQKAADDARKTLDEFRKNHAIDVSCEFRQLRGGRG